MINVQIVNGKAVKAVSEFPKDHNGYENRWDWKTFDRAQEVAEQLGPDYTAIDSGPCVSPRYDIIATPKIGDKVSYGFNGDYYPDGLITKIGGKNLRIIYTDTGNKYYRVGNTDCWIKKGGTWRLVAGHISEYNREF